MMLSLLFLILLSLEKENTRLWNGLELKETWTSKEKNHHHHQTNHHHHQQTNHHHHHHRHRIKNHKHHLHLHRHHLNPLKGLISFMEPMLIFSSWDWPFMFLAYSSFVKELFPRRKMPMERVMFVIGKVA